MLYVRVNDGKKDIHHCIIPGGRNEILSKLIICKTRVCYKGKVILPNEHDIPLTALGPETTVLCSYRLLKNDY